MTDGTVDVGKRLVAAGACRVACDNLMHADRAVVSLALTAVQKFLIKLGNFVRPLAGRWLGFNLSQQTPMSMLTKEKPQRLSNWRVRSLIKYLDMPFDDHFCCS